MSCTESDEFDEEDLDDDEEDEDESLKEESDQPFSEILAKYGFDYKSLLTVTMKKSESGVMTKYKPPLNPSLFVNVPPTINFATQDDKSRLDFNLLFKILKSTSNI